MVGKNQIEPGWQLGVPFAGCAEGTLFASGYGKDNFHIVNTPSPSYPQTITEPSQTDGMMNRKIQGSHALRKDKGAVDMKNGMFPKNKAGRVTALALVLSGRTRLRPILISSLTTIVGLIPMAVGFGGKVEMMQGMAVVVIGGLSLSTLLTLILIPTFYLIFDSKDRAERREEKCLRKEQKASAI